MNQTKIIALSQIVHLEKRPKSFVELLKEFNLIDAVENSHSPKTTAKYMRMAENFFLFLKEKNLPYLPAEEISIPILKKFTLWLSENLKSCTKTHISKHLRRINKAMDFAVMEGLIPHNPTSSYHIKRDKNKIPVSMEDEEFLLWINMEWSQKIYQHAQDNFSFQMSAGLSYMDIFNYKTILNKGKLWIESSRGKNGKIYYVPLWHSDFSLALHLHEKHKGKFPYIENHFYNRLIREMAAQIGIEKYLTSHVARKTFATLKDESGWNISAISAMLGNTKKVCEEHYVRPGKKSIENELLRLGR